MILKRRETKEVEEDVKLPYFCKKNGDYFKLVSEDLVIKATKGEKYAAITMGVFLFYGSDIEKATQINEAEFDLAFWETKEAIEEAFKKEVFELTDERAINDLVIQNNLS